MDRTNPLCSAKLVAEPSVAFKLVARPFVSVPEMSMEPVRDLNNVSWLEKFDVEPIDTLSDNVRPWANVVASPRESDRDLNIEACSTRLVDALMEADRSLGNVLASEPPSDNDPIRDLNHELCSMKLDDEPSEPLSA